MTYLIASDDNGFIQSKRMKAKSLTDSDCHAFAQQLFPNARIYGQVERCSPNARIVHFYQSVNAQGVGRIGRNWVALAIASPVRCDSQSCYAVGNTEPHFHSE